MLPWPFKGISLILSLVFQQRISGGPPDSVSSPLLGNPSTFGSMDPLRSGAATFSENFFSRNLNISVIDAVPSQRNVTRVDYTWRTPREEDVVVAGVLPLYNLTFAGAHLCVCLFL